MSIEKPTIVLFDMDGTTVRHVNPLLLSTLEFLDNLIYKTGALISRRKEIKDYSHAPAAPRGLLVHKMLHKIRRKPVDAIVQPCPGIYLLLNLFHANNIPIGVVSNSLGKGYGHDVLKTFSLSQYYQAEIFREDIQKSKPHPDPILRALRDIKEEPDEDDVIWYFGDRHKDVVASLEADKLVKGKIVPFAYGINSAIAILKYNVGNEHIIMSYPDFYQQIVEMFDNPVQQSTPMGKASAEIKSLVVDKVEEAAE
ncbi:MAG: HAD hydrolase-like protein [Pseudomonadota bacterium]